MISFIFIECIDVHYIGIFETRYVSNILWHVLVMRKTMHGARKCRRLGKKSRKKRWNQWLIIRKGDHKCELHPWHLRLIQRGACPTINFLHHNKIICINKTIPVYTTKSTFSQYYYSWKYLLPPLSTKSTQKQVTSDSGHLSTKLHPKKIQKFTQE